MKFTVVGKVAGFEGFEGVITGHGFDFPLQRKRTRRCNAGFKLEADSASHDFRRDIALVGAHCSLGEELFRPLRGNFLSVPGHMYVLLCGVSLHS